MREALAWNSNDLIQQYKYHSSGHFFDADTMRFFKSRVTSNYKRVSDTVAYFITTEKRGFEDFTRVATIRRAELVSYIREDGRECLKIKIETVKDGARVSLYTAKKLMREIKE